MKLNNYILWIAKCSSSRQYMQRPIIIFINNGSLVSLLHKDITFIWQKDIIKGFTNLLPVSKSAWVSMPVSVPLGLSWGIVLALLLSTTFAAA